MTSVQHSSVKNQFYPFFHQNLHPIETLRHLEVCYSPALLPFYKTDGRTVVIIDIFRASSAICSALAHGVKEIIPVKTLEEAKHFKQEGYIVAAERDGAVVENFDFGNSPYAFMDENLKGKSVVLTTSNCTAAIHMVEDANEILIGAFSNLSVMAAYLRTVKNDVLLLCSGWKNRYNLEDSIYAGALVNLLREDFMIEDDAALASYHLYHEAKADIQSFISNSSHSRRLRHLHIEKDIAYCVIPDKAPVIPRFNGKSLTL